MLDYFFAQIVRMTTTITKIFYHVIARFDVMNCNRTVMCCLN